MIINPPTVHTTMITVVVPSEDESEVDELVGVVPADTAVTDAAAELSEGIMSTQTGLNWDTVTGNESPLAIVPCNVKTFEVAS